MNPRTRFIFLQVWDLQFEFNHGVGKFFKIYMMFANVLNEFIGKYITIRIRISDGTF